MSSHLGRRHPRRIKTPPRRRKCHERPLPALSPRRQQMLAQLHADPRLACTTCHNPHEPLNQSANSYDAKCLTCHNAAAHTENSAATSTPKICPQSKSNCITCHMPQSKSPLSTPPSSTTASASSAPTPPTPCNGSRPRKKIRGATLLRPMSAQSPDLASP